MAVVVTKRSVEGGDAYFAPMSLHRLGASAPRSGARQSYPRSRRQIAIAPAAAGGGATILPLMNHYLS